MRKFILFLLIVSLTPTYAQNANVRVLRTNASPISETVFVNTNTTTLITGETLHIKLYCLDRNSHTQSLISKIAYVDLVGNDKKVISRQKLLLQKGTAGADFFIPTTLQSGSYKLIAYTRWMLGESLRNFYEIDIMVINPYLASKFEKTTVKASLSDTLPVSNPNAHVKSDKKTYHPREKTVLNIAAPLGNYSVSIRKTDALFQKKQILPQEFVALGSLKKNDNIGRFNTVFLPELRGELLTGKIVSSTTTSLKDKIVALTIKGEPFSLKIVKTNAIGQFSFLLDSHLLNSDVIVQLVDENRSNYTVMLDELREPDFSELQFSTALPIMPADKEVILQRSVASQIENAYYSSKKYSIKAAIKIPTFYESIEKEYLLDDYTRFPTIRETITEVVEEADYTKTKKGYHLFIRNYYAETSIYGPPLVLLDGFPIQDMNVLFDYPANNIFKIGIINVPYIYGPKTFSGVISFITKSNDFEPTIHAGFIKKFTALRPAPEKIYFNPNYSDENKNNRIPDYRHQLLWQPDVNLNNPETLFTCYTSDVTGTFEVVLQGFTADGTAVYVKDYFEVK